MDPENMMNSFAENVEQYQTGLCKNLHQAEQRIVCIFDCK